MSAFGGGGEDAGGIEIPLILNLDDYRKGLEDARAQGEASGKSVGGSISGGFKKAIRTVAALTLGVRGLRSIVHQLHASFQRLEQLRGVADPATGSFEKLKQSVTDLLDSFVLGVLRSQSLQAVLNTVADALEEAAKSAGGLGKKIDAWAKEHSEQVAFFVGEVYGFFAYLKNAYDITYNTFKLAADGISYVAGLVVEFLGKVANGLATVLKWVGADDSAKSIKGLADEWKSFGAALQKVAGDDIGNVSDAFSKSWDEILDSAAKGYEKAKKMLAELDPTKTPEGGMGSAGGLQFFGQEGWLQSSPIGKTVLTATQGLADAVHETWQQAALRIGKLFDGIAKNLKNSIDAGLAKGIGSVFEGLAAAGAQAEAAFGKSAAAAQVFADIELGLQALMAMVRGMMELADASAEEAHGNMGSSAVHLTSSALFFTAAGLAGGRAAGLFGTPGAGSGGVAAATGASSSARGTVAARQTNVIINIEGNMVADQEYVANTVVPALRNLVQNNNYTVVASHAQTSTPNAPMPTI